MPDNVCQPVGCDECRHTGFLGRTGIYEILTLDSEMRAHIKSDTNIDAIRKAASKTGMRTLKIGGAQKVADGITTLEEVYSVLPQEYT